MICSIRKAVAVAALTVVTAGSLYTFSPVARAEPIDTDKKQGHPNEGHAQKKAQGGDIIDVATGAGMSEVTTLVKAVQAAGLVETLKGDGPFTVFAPTNAAFQKLPAGTVEDLLKPENKEKLKDLLLYHVHVGKAIKAADMKTMTLTTALGAPLEVKVDGDKVRIGNNATSGDAKVIKTDVVASNGVIHWIDTVVTPMAH